MGKYYFTRNQSTVAAFAVGGKWEAGTGKGGFTMAAAHTDSPRLVVKPVSKRTKEGFLQVGVETYGGGLWHTWFDRDLSLAGRVAVRNEAGDSFANKLVKIDRPIMRIPNLAIHLTAREDRGNFKVNKENHLSAILGTVVFEELSKPADDPSKEEDQTKKSPLEGDHHSVLMAILAQELGITAERVVDFELVLYDTQPSTIGGAWNEFIYAPRLDNLCSSFICMEALIHSKGLEDDANVRFLILFDHEEVGSRSSSGAMSTICQTTFRRINKGYDGMEASMARSICVSMDMAHGVHPNYAS